MGYSTVRRIMREGLTDPRNLDGIALWNSTRDVTDLTTDTGIKLWADKSGNSSTNVLCLNGVGGNYASAPDSAALDIVGDITLIAQIEADDYTPVSGQSIFGKIAASNLSYRLDITSTGRLNALVSPNGTTYGVNLDSTAAIPFSDLGRGWVAMTRESSSGNIKFYTAASSSSMPSFPASWTQLGTTVAGTSGAVFSGNAALNVGANSSGSNSFSGRIYNAKIYNGYDGAGTLVFDANFALPAKLATSFTESSSNAATVTINTSGATGARISGARDLYQGTAANQPILTIAAAGNYLTFDGSNDYLKAAAFALAQPETVYFVGSQVTWTSTDRLYDGNTGASMTLRQVVGTPQLGITAGSSLNGASLTLATNGVVTSVFNGASSAVRVNRTAAITGDAGVLGNGGGFTLGSASDGTLSANITAQEVLVYSTAQDENYQYRVTRLLSRRTGVLVV